MKRKPILAVLLALTLVLSMMPTVAFAEGGTVDNAKTFSFIGGETTQADIDAAWGEGAVSYTSEEIDGETVYTIKLLKDINMAAGCDVRIGEYRENGPELPQMILDLNGCTINSSSIGLINYGDLIIRDTSEAKTGCIKYSTTSDKSSLVAISHKGGLLVIEDGNFICESGYAFTGYVAAVSTQAGAVTHIKGGTFTSNSSAVLSAGETVVCGGNRRDHKRGFRDSASAGDQRQNRAGVAGGKCALVAGQQGIQSHAGCGGSAGGIRLRSRSGTAPLYGRGIRLYNL